MSDQQPLVVCTDGSHVGPPRSESGYAVVLPDGVAHYGPVPTGLFRPFAAEDAGDRFDPELYAIHHALTVTTGPLRIVTDAGSHAQHLMDGTLPRRPVEAPAFDAIRAAMRARPVSFEVRQNDTGPPQHAAAHYLAFRGRRGEVGEGVLLPEAEDILNHPDPYQRAAELVRYTLFPALRH